MFTRKFHASLNCKRLEALSNIGYPATGLALLEAGCNVPRRQTVGNSRMGKPLRLSQTKLRSALTNGTSFLPDVDGRSLHVRRYRDLCVLFVSDLGGEDAGLSTGQLALARRAATITVALEQMEAKFAQKDGPTGLELREYGRATNTLRRLIESLGIANGRKARDATPSLSEYLASKRVRTIEHDEDDTEDAA